MKNLKKICIIIPAFNEAEVIAKVIKSIKLECKKARIDADIVIVDDGSSDNKPVVASRSGSVVIKHILNTGVGGATATGIKYAKNNGYSLAATMDADGQHSSEDVITGIKNLQKNKVDLLIGSRLINPKGMSTIKLIGNKGLSYITRLLYGVNTSDSQSGLRIYSRKSLEKLKWNNNGYEFCSEMLWRAKQEGLIIAEYPIKAIYSEYSKSKGQNNWNAINIVKTIIKHRFMEIFG